MGKPVEITLTTYWLDWLLLPVSLFLGWMTSRWALGDYRRALQLKRNGDESVPAFLISLPLFISAIGWVILGCASLIRQEYWEHRFWCVVLAVWSLSSFFGALFAAIRLCIKQKQRSLADIFNFLGLLLLPVIICLPALMEIPVGTKAVVLSHAWTALSLFCVISLSIGLLKGFTYNYTRFALAIGILIFIGLGGIELDSGRSAFPWFSRIWDLQLEQGEFEAMLPEARTGWRIIGGLKFLVGIGIGIFLIISRRLSAKRNHKNRR